MGNLDHDENGATAFHPACIHKVSQPRKKPRTTRLQLAVGDKVRLEHNAREYAVKVRQLQPGGVLFHYSSDWDELVPMNKNDGRVRALEWN